MVLRGDPVEALRRARTYATAFPHVGTFQVACGLLAARTGDWKAAYGCLRPGVRAGMVGDGNVLAISIHIRSMDQC